MRKTITITTTQITCDLCGNILEEPLSCPICHADLCDHCGVYIYYRRKRVDATVCPKHVEYLDTLTNTMPPDKLDDEDMPFTFIG